MRSSDSKWKRKLKELEAGYDTLIEMQPHDEMKYLEKKAGMMDEAITTHARILPMLARCPTEVTINRTHNGGDNKDPQLRIRESLKPVNLKKRLLARGIQKVDGSNQNIPCSI